MDITSDALGKESQVVEDISRPSSFDFERNMRQSQSNLVASIHIPSSVYWLRFLDSRCYTELFVVSPKTTPENTPKNSLRVENTPWQSSNHTSNLGKQCQRLSGENMQLVAGPVRSWGGFCFRGKWTGSIFRETERKRAEHRGFEGDMMLMRLIYRVFTLLYTTFSNIQCQ